MKAKILYGTSAGAFIVAIQLLFFWLISPSSALFPAIYPFYTILPLAHVLIMFYVCLKYKYPASFAPSFVGSIITVAEIVGTILLGIFTTSIRTAVFAEAITSVVYILVMALLIGIESNESPTSDIPHEAVRPYATNVPFIEDDCIPTEQLPVVPRTNPAATSNQQNSRIPKAIMRNNQ